MNELLLEPLKYYEQVGAAEHEKNATERFDTLLKQSGVDAEANRATVKKYRAETHALEKMRDSRSKQNAFRVLLILAIVGGAILAIYGLTALSSSVLRGCLCVGGGAGLIVLGALLLKKKVLPAIRSLDEKIAVRQKAADALLAEAERQTASLNALFRQDEAVRLIEKTIPEFSFSERFSVEEQTLFEEKYDLSTNDSEELSTLDTLSGNFSGNPFFYRLVKRHRLGMQTYHGSRVISWRETYYDKDGHPRTRTVTQTLHASVTKPKPFYDEQTSLYYGTQAAPDLCFSRSPKHSERLSESERERKVRRGEKKLKKKSEKSLAKGGNFQSMANAEFDVLFGADDRNHEVQFRLAYTPLAQRSTVALLTSRGGYGDDFYFYKRRRCNEICSEHAQVWAMDASPSRYYSYDVDDCRKKFIDFQRNYFKSLFFDFAPCFAIPAYMEAPAASLEMPPSQKASFTSYEHEVLANALGARNLAHPASQTDAILKTRFLGHAEDADGVEVTAYSYDTALRVDHIPTFGGDGKLHDVPVPWTEYIPLRRTTQIALASQAAAEGKKCEKLRIEAAKSVLFHGAVAWLLE